MKQNRIKRIDLLKIDAEGAEYDILLGLKDLSPIGSIILEYHDYLDHGHTFREIMEKLSANGFKVKVGGPRLHRLLLRTGYIVAER